MIMNKTTFFHLLFLLPFALGGCSDNDNDKDNVIDRSENYDTFQKFDLKIFDIPATIMLPDETANIGASTNPEVLHKTDGFKWDLSVGPNFSVHIEDWGANKGLVADKKKQLKELEIYDIEYFEDEKDFIIYKLKLKVSGVKSALKDVGVPHESWHVFAEKEIDGITYELRSPDAGFEKVIIELMAKTIRSFQPQEVKKPA
jgi:hypothetical protein